jgi:hypothetical protein
MKSILLASASVVAFAGAASAEITFGGSATVGFNDTVNAFDDNNEGFYWDANVAVTMSQALDNGLTASATFDFDVAEDNLGQTLVSGSYLLSLTSDMGGLYFGDTAFAAETYWASAGDMEADGFSEADGEVVLRGEVMMGGVTAGLSYVVADADGEFVNDNTVEYVDQLSVGATGSFGNFNFAIAYQEEALGASGFYDAEGANGDFNNDEIFGLSVGSSFAGADVTVAYAQNNTAGIDSLGVKVAYPVGPVTVTAYYVAESADVGDPDDNYGINVAYASGPISVTADFQDDQGTQKIALDGSYDIGNGVTVLAGFYTADDRAEDEYYIAASYDIGGGASLLASYAVGETNPDDEIGAGDYQEGLTLEASFSF